MDIGTRVVVVTAHPADADFLGMVGTIRAKSAKRERPEYRIDNGRPDDPDMATNGWSKSIWIACRRVKPSTTPILAAPIITWNGAKVHLVTALDGDTARTSCGEVTEDAHLLMSAARELSKPVPCLNCHREERESL